MELNFNSKLIFDPMDISTGSKFFIAGSPFKTQGFELAAAQDCELRIFISPFQVVALALNEMKQVIFLQPFQPVSAISNTQDFIHSVLTGNRYFKERFRKKTIVLLTQNFSVFPEEIADQEFSGAWKSKMTGNHDSILCHDILKIVKAEIVYTLEAGVKNSLDEVLGSYSIINAVSVEIEFLASRNSGRKIYCNVHTGYMQLLLLNNANVEFLNVFSYESPDDFIYFLMAVYNNWGLNPEVDPLVLLGEVVKDSSMYHFVYKYIRNVEFGRFNNEVSFPKDYPFPPHFYFSLIT